ncbi:MAG: phosphatase PAP2 family protein [Anaerolineales bacterium]|nr:phosphatase PAP2 family protein [Anaerolineales bacterium]
MTNILWQILPWGYQVLLSIEAMRNGFFNIIFPIITEIGGELGYLFILTVVYWSVNKSIGQGLAYAYMVSGVIITWLKAIWGIPRPDSSAIEDALKQAGISRRLMPLAHETSPAFPSGHAFQATISWGYMAAAFKNPWCWVLAVIMALLIGFSRMYLGVHYPQDVLAGWGFGIIYLVIWWLAEPYIRAWFSKLAVGWRYTLAVLVPLILLTIYPAHDSSSAMAAIIGLGIGFVLEGQTIRFTTTGSLQQRVLRAFVGLVPLVVLFLGLRVLFGLFDESMGPAMSIVWHVIRYALIGFLAAWGAPWLFVRFGMAKQET